MITSKELISENIPVISPIEQGAIALNWMEIYKISHIPIIENKKLIAVISESDIYDENEPEKPVGDYKFIDEPIFVYEDQHIYDVINMFSDNKITLLPVLNKKNNYIGSIIQQDLLSAVKKITSVDSQGGVIVLEIGQNDYSLTEIANIIEAEEGKIVSLYANNNLKKNKIDITIKINKEDLSSIISSLERFNYKVNVSYCSNRAVDTIYEERYNELLDYLNI